MNQLQIINNFQAIKDAFGDFSILNDMSMVDMPAICEFATIVSNYLKMQRLNDPLRCANLTGSGEGI